MGDVQTFTHVFRVQISQLNGGPLAIAIAGKMDPEASIDASEFNFSQIKSFTSLLKNISLVQ